MTIKHRATDLDTTKLLITPLLLLSVYMAFHAESGLSMTLFGLVSVVLTCLRVRVEN